MDVTKILNCLSHEQQMKRHNQLIHEVKDCCIQPQGELKHNLAYIGKYYLSNDNNITTNGDDGDNWQDGSVSKSASHHV